MRVAFGEDGRVTAEPVPFVGSGDLFGFARANGLAVVPEEHPPFAAGEVVDVLLLGSVLA